MTVEHVYFRSGDVRCAADLYLPEDTPAAGVVMGHSVLVVKKALAPHAEYLQVGDVHRYCRMSAISATPHSD